MKWYVAFEKSSKRDCLAGIVFVNDDGSALSSEQEKLLRVSSAYFSGTTGEGEHPCHHIKATRFTPITAFFPNTDLHWLKVYFGWYRDAWACRVSWMGVNTWDEIIYLGVPRDSNLDNKTFYDDPSKIVRSDEWIHWNRIRPYTSRGRCKWDDGFDWTSPTWDAKNPTWKAPQRGRTALSYADGPNPVGPDMPLLPEFSDDELLLIDSEYPFPHGMVSELYRNAMNGLTMNANNIANGLDIAALLSKIKRGIPKPGKLGIRAIASAWMAYRYSYQTTKSDIEELGRYISRIQGSKNVVRSALNNNLIQAHMKIQYKDRKLNSVQELYVSLKRMGLALDAYNAWDLIPMSFVVDWFLPIGNTLEDFSQNWVADEGIFDISNITYSRKYHDIVFRYGSLAQIDGYQRIIMDTPPPFEVYSEDPNTKTVIKRVFDGISMIILHSKGGQL